MTEKHSGPDALTGATGAGNGPRLAKRTGAKTWSKWTLREAHEQGQQELFDHYSENPEKALARQRRRKRRVGVWG
jgi:hypothetical protein